MTCVSSPINPRATRLVHLVTAVLLMCAPVVAEQSAPISPLTADEVIARVVAMNEMRGKALESYSSLRSYHLECHCLVPKKADMVVRADYRSPDKKEFTVVSESGSGTVRDKVFKKLLEAELESMRDANQQLSAVTPDNYKFTLVEYRKSDNNEFYVLNAHPRTKNKFLFRGRIWVDGKDFAITRVEGEPAVNPSWWTRKTDFTRTYQKIGDFWLPQSNDSVTHVRVFGTAVLTIKYREYKIAEAPGMKIAVLPDVAQGF